MWCATQAGIETARTGVTCRELFQSMREVIATLDNQGGDVGRLGHGLGMQLTEWPSLAQFDDTVIEENILVQADGARLLTKRATQELPII